MGWSVERIDDMLIAYKTLVGNTQSNRPLGNLNCRWEGNIKMDFGEIRMEDVDWIHLAQYRGR
jgi:hypothetical protein